jgi:FkbM family methyltransferase
VRTVNCHLGCSNHRYVQFRDTKSLEIVGLFGLEGQYDFKDYDYDSYAKRIFNLVPENGKKNIISVLNEIICYETYSNEWIDIEEGDTVVDIGFNYGLFSITSKMKKPKKIIGFEPNPKLLEQLNSNVSTQEFESLVFPYAVSNKKGTSQFNIIENEGKTNPGCSSLHDLKVSLEIYHDITKVDTCTVETINIDEFLLENNSLYD